MSVLSAGTPAPVRPGAAKARRKKTRLRSSYNLIAGIAIVLIGFPVYWMVATAFKPGDKALSPTPQWFPWPLTMENFRAAVHKDFFLSSLRNSVLVVVCVVILALLVASLAALAVSRFKFRGRALFIVLIVGIQMVPLAGLVIPLFRVLATAHLTNRIPGLVLAYLTFVLPFTVWTLRGFIINIPVELEEAALVDGCSRTSAFFRITLPLIAPGLVATGIFAFIQAWNDFLLAVTIMQNNKDYTATVWLSFFTNRQGTSYPQLMAGSTIIAAPVVVFFMAIQHRVATGLTAGAVKGVSLERTVAALLLPGFDGLVAPRWVHERIAGGLGGVTLYGRNVGDASRLAALTASLHADGDGFVVSIDEEGGDVTRVEVATGSSYPGNGALGAVDDVALTAAVAAALGGSLAAYGVDLDLAPVADVNVDPRNPVIGIRSFGADPAAASRHVAGYVQGLQSAGVAACLKHFPGHGNTYVDSHRGLPVVDDDLETLERVALPPFRAGISAGAKAVMTAHLVVPAYDSVPATISRRILTGVLREELGFTGVIVADGLDMAGLSDTVGFLEGAVLSLAAGTDLLCTGGSPTGEDTVEALTRAIVAAVAEGRLSADALEASADRVRDLGRWSAKHRADDFDVRAAQNVGRHAAERALTTEGDVAVAPGALVVRLCSRPNEAVGIVPWGVATPMAALDPTVDEVAVESLEVDAASLVAAAAGRPLVVVVRDLHRIDWHAGVLAALTTARPDLVVVEMGLPVQRPQGVRGYLMTFGAARVNGEAAARVLLPASS